MQNLVLPKRCESIVKPGTSNTWYWCGVSMSENRIKPLVSYHCSKFLWFLAGLWQGLYNILTLHFCVCVFNVLSLWMLHNCSVLPRASLLPTHKVLVNVSHGFNGIFHYCSTEWILALKLLAPVISPNFFYFQIASSHGGHIDTVLTIHCCRGSEKLKFCLPTRLLMD